MYNCQGIEGIIASMYRKPKEILAGEASQQLYFTKAAAAGTSDQPRQITLGRCAQCHVQTAATSVARRVGLVSTMPTVLVVFASVREKSIETNQ